MSATRITSESLKAAGVAPEEFQALARQARGGASGGRGYGYEDHFAVARLVAASLAWFERGEDWALTLGHPCCWVDDVVVERPDREEYAQLKTSPDETWRRDGARLVTQFRRQAALCRGRGVDNFTLAVVTPHEDRQLQFRTEMPDDLRDFTDAELFRDGRIGWSRDSPLAGEIAQLCAVEPEPSVREHLVHAMYGAYHRMRQRGDTLTSSSFTAAVAEDERVPLRSSATVVDATRWEVVTAALAASLPGLRLQLRRGFIVYDYLDDERGTVARADSASTTRFLERLAARVPRTIEDFHKELP